MNSSKTDTIISKERTNENVVETKNNDLVAGQSLPMNSNKTKLPRNESKQKKTYSSSENNANRGRSPIPATYKWSKYRTEQEELQERLYNFYERKLENKKKKEIEEDSSNWKHVQLLNTHPYCRQATEEEINTAKMIQYKKTKSKTNIGVINTNKMAPNKPINVANRVGINNTITHPYEKFSESQHQKQYPSNINKAIGCHQRQGQEGSCTDTGVMQKEQKMSHDGDRLIIDTPQGVPTCLMDYLDPDNQNKLEEATSSVLHLHNMHRLSRLVRENKFLNKKLDLHAKKISEKDTVITRLESELTRAKNLDTISGDLDIKNNINLLQMDLQAIQQNYLDNFLEEEYAECVSHIRQIAAKVGVH